ncbi:MAG: STN domain-containing protein [Bacteroidales bacterium]|jgi:hypothetical protein|nr:STN domain-containing protein [Bacteroidales bacterium]
MHTKLPNKIFSFFLFFVLIFTISNNIFAQQKVSEAKITLNENEKSISQILNIISNQGRLKFSYNPQIIDDEKIISINIYNAGIDEVLNSIFEGKISYKNIDNYIILSEKIIEKEAKVKIKPTEKVIENVSIEKEILLPVKKIEYKDIGKIESNCLNHVNKINDEDMKKHFMTILLASVIVADTIIAQETKQNSDVNSEIKKEQKEGTYKPFNFSLIYPLGSDWVNSARNEYNFSLSLIGNVIGKTKGVELAPVFNVNRYGVKGAQISAGFNLASASACHCKDGEQRNELVEESNALQIAAIFNYTGFGTSTQFAAGFNVAKDATIQVAAIGNIASDVYTQLSAGINIAQSSKFQLSAIANIAKFSSPAQITAGINYADINALQIGAIGNIAKTKSYCQISAGVNISNNNNAQISAIMNSADTTMTQITALLNVAKASKFQLGVVNVTKKGKVQLGIVNVRDTVDGVSIGLINIAKGGVMEAGIEFGEFIFAAATFRSGIRPFYSILSVGWTKGQIYASKYINTNNNYDNMLALGFGFGSTIRLYKKLDLNLELMHYNLMHVGSPSFKYVNNNFFRLAPYFNYTFGKHLKIFAGPTFNLLCINFEDGGDKLAIIPPYTIFTHTSHIRENTFLGLDFWIGGTFGLKF